MEASVADALRALREGLEGLYGGRLVRVILFGSHARGDATPGSDLDVMVVLRGPVDALREIDRMGDLTWGIDLAHDVLLSVIPVSERDYVERHTPLLLNVRREGVPV